MRLDAGDIDRFLPQGDVGGDHRRERFGGVAERVDTERGKPLGEGCVLDGPGHLFRDPVDGLPGHRRRRHQPVPGERFKSRKPRLGEGGNVGDLRDALLARHRKQANGSAWTTRTYGLVPMTLMGARSFTGSYAVFVVSGMITICEGLPISSICPSEDERATASAASAPPAAGRFSTTNCCPNASPRGCAIRRAMPSLLPAGAKGTRILTGLCGQVCERAD